MQYRNMQYRNAQIPNSSNDSSGIFTISGTSTIEVRADVVLISAKISTRDSSLEIAQDKNNEISSTIIKSLIDSGIAQDNIYDKDISVSKHYDSGDDDLSYYEFNHVIAITTKDFSKLHDIYSLLIENGANDNINLTFMLSNPSNYYSSALRRASQDALNKIAYLASSFNLKYSPSPVKVREISSPLYSITYYSPTSYGYIPDIAPGQARITAEIEASFKTYPY